MIGALNAFKQSSFSKVGGSFSFTIDTVLIFETTEINIYFPVLLYQTGIHGVVLQTSHTLGDQV